MAATNKCLAQNSKSRTDANATNRVIKPGNDAKTMARALQRCVSHHEKTGRTDEILPQSDPDDADLHRHLLGVHGAATSGRSPYHNGRLPAQRDALVSMINHQCLQALACGLASILPSRKQLVGLRDTAPLRLKVKAMKRSLLLGVAALLLTTGAVHAGQRPYVEVGKPRIVTRIIHIQTGLLPPSQYDKPYEGELEIQFFKNSEDVKNICPNTAGLACTKTTSDYKKCFIYMLTEYALKHTGNAYNFALRHELAHCNGWHHPNTTDGKKFNLGEKWKEAEGGKWIAADTKMPTPKLPASTKMLPAYPPVVCVTPDWKSEPCGSREIKDIWSTARPLQKSDIR